MKLELAASGLTEEEILEKAKLLMKAFGKEEAGSMAEYMLLSKQMNAALIKAGLPPKDFTAVSTRDFWQKLVLDFLPRSLNIIRYAKVSG